jgi:hypothetical protein
MKRTRIRPLTLRAARRISPDREGLSDVRVSQQVCTGITWEEKLCRGTASVERREKKIVVKGRSGSDKCCFNETGNAVNGSERLACCGLVMAYYTDGAVVVISRVVMMMRCCYESSKQEKQYQECRNLTAADHGLPYHVK